VINGSLVDADAAPALDTSGDGDVAATTRIELKFDRYMLPTDAIRQAICVRSVPGTVTNINDCTSSVFLHPAYDPVRRVVTYYQDASQGSVLVPGQTYFLTVLPGSGPSGFQAFDGVALDKRYDFSFTPTAAPANTGTEAPSTDAGYCDGDNCLAGDRTVCRAEAALSRCSACHAQPEPMSPLSPAMGLMLTETDPKAAIADLALTAVGKVAHETEQGGAAQHASDHPRRFGVSMAIVAPGDPGQSYLLYKILSSSRFPLDPNDPNDAIASGESDRLRLSVVTGVSMPAKGGASEDLAMDPSGWFAETEYISAWIAAGAQLPVCKQ